MNLTKSSPFNGLNLINTLVIKRYKNKGLSITSKPIKNHLKHLYPTREQRDAQYNFDKKKYEEIVLAQNKRAVYEYPVQPDQRSSWKHKRWYDVYLNKWVNTRPEIPKTFSINYKKDRSLVFNAETPYEHFYLLLDQYLRRKYVIESFDYQTPISNISYYFQYLTNTKYIHGLPYSIANATVDDDFLNNFRSFVNDLLLLEHNKEKYNDVADPLEKSSLINAACMKAITNFLIGTTTTTDSFLSQSEVDHNVDNCMFWFRGRGFLKWTLPDDHPVAFQCHDPVFMQIRSNKQLAEFSPRDGKFSTSGEIPSFYTTPHVFKVLLFQYKNSITPGYKLFGGDCFRNYQYAMEEEQLENLPPPIYNQCRYGHTQMLLTPKTYSREWYKENFEHCDITCEIEEHLKGRGIMSGWVWTAAQAHFHQFWMDKDVDRPFCSQNIVSDGKYLSFFCYQLNTVAIDADNIEDNDKRNLCFGRTSVKLFDEVTSDEVKGLNDEALILLTKFFRNGVQQSETCVVSEEVLEDYNQSLPVQECDPERPDLELQKPLHKLEFDKVREAAEEALRLEEEKNNSLKAKLMKRFLPSR